MNLCRSSLINKTTYRHPDKTDNPKAEEKFVEIKKAYELLADTERRKAYDLHGITNEDANVRRTTHDYSQYGRFNSDPFEEFFGYLSHIFNCQETDILICEIWFFQFLQP